LLRSGIGEEAWNLQNSLAIEAMAECIDGVVDLRLSSNESIEEINSRLSDAIDKFKTAQDRLNSHLVGKKSEELVVQDQKMANSLAKAHTLFAVSHIGIRLKQAANANRRTSDD
jgi:hypothetical protein